MDWPVCDICGEEVTTSNGFIDIDKHEVENSESARHAWDQEHSGRLQSFAESISAPEPAKWQWGHLNCITGEMYQITADRFDTLGKALDWTLHLMEKGWLEETDWGAFVRRVHDVPHP